LESIIKSEFEPILLIGGTWSHLYTSLCVLLL